MSQFEVKVERIKMSDVANKNISSSMFQSLIQKILQASQSRDNLCIIGEIGTGKRQAAISVHKASGADVGRFSIVNCMALEHNAFMSETFGQVSTDGDLVRKGAVVLADGGTLYLHEVHELSRKSQSALVRFLETKSYRPVGSSTNFSANVRMIASSSATLEALVAAGKFRQDLLHFMTPVIIHMPRLNDRLEDIPTLFRSLLYQLGEGHSITIDDEALVRLKSHSYTGNLLELRNLALRCLSSMKGNYVTLADVNAAIGGTAYFDLADKNFEGVYAELARNADDQQYKSIADLPRIPRLEASGNEPVAQKASDKTSTKFEALNRHMFMSDIVDNEAIGDPVDRNAVRDDEEKSPKPKRGKEEAGALPRLKEVERQYFIELLDKFKGDKSKVAESAGLNLRTLYRRLKLLNIN